LCLCLGLCLRLLLNHDSLAKHLCLLLLLHHLRIIRDYES
jgi:hypothetical protein